jgi:hypothetical protein
MIEYVRTIQRTSALQPLINLAKINMWVCGPAAITGAALNVPSPIIGLVLGIAFAPMVFTYIMFFWLRKRDPDLLYPKIITEPWEPDNERNRRKVG